MPAGLTFENICSLELFILMHEHREIFLEILSSQLATDNNNNSAITRSNDCELTFENIYNLELFILMHEHREICLIYCLIYKRVPIEILSSQLANRKDSIQ